MTYNRRITEMIVRGEVKEREVEGVRVYRVPKPGPLEEVDGYTNFSDCFGEMTATKIALVKE
jgi:hypothetical protein